MNEDKFNMSLRKFLKQVGVTSQREIERVVRAHGGKGKLKVKMVLTAAGTDLNHVVEEDLDLGEPGGGRMPCTSRTRAFRPCSRATPSRRRRSRSPRRAGGASARARSRRRGVEPQHRTRGDRRRARARGGARARLQMGPLMMVALGDSLGSLCPPKVAISIAGRTASCSTARSPGRCASPRRACLTPRAGVAGGGR